MPQSVAIGILVLGAVMLLLALVSGSFKIFGSEIPTVANRTARVIAFAIGVVLVGFSLMHFQADPGPKPQPSPHAADAGGQRDEAVAGQAGGADADAGVLPPKDILNDPSAVRVVGREAQDFGVAPRNTIEENVGTYTPLTIPGARTITTGELYNAGTQGRRFLLVDVLDQPHAGLPSARRYPGVGMPTPSTDLAQLLEKDTGGDKAYPVVFYCQGPQCWESYNAALRARDAGYSNVYWYRGGLEAWSQAGLQLF